MRKDLGLALAAAALLAGQAHAAERYEQLAAAEALDETCGYLPYVEHQALGYLTSDAVEFSNMASTAQKMGSNAVADFYKAQKANAQATACTPENGNAVVLPVRGDVLMELAVAASTAVQLDQKAREPQVDAFGLPTFGFSTAQPLSAEDIEDANKLANYVAGVVGANNAQAFFAQANQTAANRIADDPDGQEYRWSLLIYDVDYQARAELDKKALLGGPYPWQRLRDASGDTLSQRKASFGHGYSGFVYLMVKDGKVYASAHETRKGAIAGQTGLRLYIRKPDAPSTVNDLPLSWNASWRGQARSFDLTPASGTAFGGALYAVPPEAVTAMLTLKDNDSAEIAIVQGTEDQADMNGSSRSAFDIGPIREALKPNP